MRIIAGIYRGKKLFSPVDGKIRPTADRARESIFNILRSKLGGDFDSVRLIDVFAGTGAFGLEAISRGVEAVCFIDMDTANVKKNASLFTKETAKIKIVQSDAAKLPKAYAKYNTVFMDAPYKKGLSEKALQELMNKGWLSPNALVIVETDKNEKLILEENITIIDERNYGTAKFWFLRLPA